MMNFKLSFIPLCLFLLLSLSGQAQKDFEIIKNRITDELISGRVDDSDITTLVKTLRDDGTWPGINYEDVSNTGFEHSIHYSNMVLIARAYAKQGSAWYRKTDAKNAVEKSLSFWVTNDFICENWWYNQIGTPDNLVSVMLLIGHELPKDLVEKAQPIIGRAHLDASGARPSGDRIKIAGILAKNLLFTGDRKKFDEVIRVIEGEIKFSTERGMQYDYSFHHRVDRVNNTLSYGLGYADAFAEWASYVAGTSYAFSDKALNQLTDYYLNGICKSMAFGTFSDTGAKNRDITRPGGHRAYGTATVERLLKATSYRKDELEQILSIRKGEIKPALSHSTFFWHSEHYTHQRPGWFSSVRMYSERNHNMEEPYNSEGLLNHHRGDGTNYTSRTMKEYADLAPVYDWQKIPGATIVQKPSLPSEKQIQKLGLTNFVGAVTDGQYGAVAFDFKSPHDRLDVKKSWFFFDEEYVCLGAGINAPGNQPVVTTLNQCHLNGPVTVMRSGTLMVPVKGEHALENVQWIHHDGMGYLFFEPVPVMLANQPSTGSWYAVNRQSTMSKEEISLDVFKLWMDHGQRVTNGQYAYMVVPVATAEQMAEIRYNRNIEILANTPEVQAVSHKGLNLHQIVFYKGGEVNLPGGFKLECDSQGVVMVKTQNGRVLSVSAADPSRKLRKLHLTLSGEVILSGEPANCTFDKTKNQTTVAITLPLGVYAGKSVTIN